MHNLLKKIWPSFLKNADQYLLVNYPLIWASRLHYVSFVGIVFFCINFLLSFILPVNYLSILASGWIFYYSCIIGIIIFIGWLYYQNIIDFQLFHGHIRSDHYVKVILISHIVIVLIAFAMVVPYLNFQRRMANAIFDSSLPMPVVADDYAKVRDIPRGVADTTQYQNLDSATVTKKTRIDRVLDSMDVEISAYQTDGGGQLPNAEIVWLFLKQRFDDVRLISIDDKNLVIEERLMDSAGNKYVYPKIKVSYNNPRINELPSRLFQNDIIDQLTFQLVSLNSKSQKPLEVFCYQNKGRRNFYKYCDADDLQDSLRDDKLRDEIATANPGMNIEDRNVMFKTLSLNFSNTGVKDLDPDFKRGVLYCVLMGLYFFIFVAILIRYFGLISFLVAFFSSLLTGGFFLILLISILGTGSSRENQALLAFTSLALIALFMIWRLGQLKKRKPSSAVAIQVFAYYGAFALPFCFIYMLSLISHDIFAFSSRMTFMDYFFISIFTIIYLFVYPWFLISTFHKFIAVPQE